MESLYDFFASQLSKIFWEALKHFMNAHGELVLSNIPTAFSNAIAPKYSQQVCGKCLALDNVGRYRDKNFLGIARSLGRHSIQHNVYNV